MSWAEMWAELGCELLAAFPVGTVIALGDDGGLYRWVRQDVHDRPRWVDAEGVVTRSASHAELAQGLVEAGLHSVELPDAKEYKVQTRSSGVCAGMPMRVAGSWHDVADAPSGSKDFCEGWIAGAWEHFHGGWQPEYRIVEKEAEERKSESKID